MGALIVSSYLWGTHYLLPGVLELAWPGSCLEAGFGGAKEG